jgi:tRNA G18 (ribose-2'-O)-methylase SpoU
VTQANRWTAWTAAARARLVAAAEKREGGFVLEGKKLVADALARSTVRVRELWLAEDLEQATVESLAEAARARGTAVGRAPTKELDRTSDVVTPQGVLALADDPARGVDEVVAAANGPLVLLDGVQDPGNVGAILRVAAAFGFSGALIGAGTADPVGTKALRASAGAALVIPFARGPVDRLLDAIRGAGRPIWLLEGEGTSLWDVKSRATAPVIAVGSEGRGPSAAVRAASVARLSIPISSSIESLNAAVAFGIAAAHVARLSVVEVRRPADVAAANPSKRSTR